MNARRGVALLVTLMTMTVLLAGITIIASVRTTSGLNARQANASVLAHDVLRASDSAIMIWLEEKSSGAVIDPESEAPMVPVLNDTTILADQTLRIRITAWDQLGMIPLNADELGLDLRSMQDTDEVQWMGERYPGLDQGIMTQSAFPSPEHPDAVGGVVATHNPWPSRSGTTRSRAATSININTATKELIEECFRTFNLGDPAPIFERRATGELAAFTTESQSPQLQTVRMVSVSRVWSFRVDVWVGTMQRSWWCTYANQGGVWRLMQRVGIGRD